MPYVKTDRLTLVTFSIEMMKASLVGNGELEKITNYNVPSEYPMDVYKELLPYKIERLVSIPKRMSGKVLSFTQMIISLLGIWDLKVDLTKMEKWT